MSIRRFEIFYDQFKGDKLLRLEGVKFSDGLFVVNGEMFKGVHIESEQELERIWFIWLSQEAILAISQYFMMARSDTWMKSSYVNVDKLSTGLSTEGG